MGDKGVDPDRSLPALTTWISGKIPIHADGGDKTSEMGVRGAKRSVRRPGRN
jgi:hypothetical protein